MPKAVAVAAICLVAAGPVQAREKDVHRITCDMVRAYVAQIGEAQARAVALAHGPRRRSSWPGAAWAVEDLIDMEDLFGYD